jgi:hypothetical protein
MKVGNADLKSLEFVAYEIQQTVSQMRARRRDKGARLDL